MIQASEINKQLCPTRVGPLQAHAISSMQATQVPDPMRARNGVLLAVVLSVLPSAAGTLELGSCGPAKAVKIIDTSLGKRKTLQQDMEMMIQAKVFDGSKACITFIRETSMKLRDSYPRAFQSL